MNRLLSMMSSWRGNSRSSSSSSNSSSNMPRSIQEIVHAIDNEKGDDDPDNMKSLAKILDKNANAGSLAVSYIEMALSHAAGSAGNVKACSLLCDRLPKSLISKYQSSKAANANNDSSSPPPLHTAALNGHVEVLRFLVTVKDKQENNKKSGNKKALRLVFNIHQLDHLNRTPLICAVMSAIRNRITRTGGGGGHDNDDDLLVTVRFLLQHGGADPNYDGRCPKIKYHGHYPPDDDPKQKTMPNNTFGSSFLQYKDDTPLMRAVRANYTALVGLLLQYGANPNHLRQPAHQEEKLKQTYYYINQKKQTCWRDNPRHTDRAIQHGNAQMLDLLLSHGAYVGSDFNNNYNSSSNNNDDKQQCVVGVATSLNNLLHDKVCKNRQDKVSIVRMLVEHAHAAREEDDDGTTSTSTTNKNATRVFLQTTLEQAIVMLGHDESCAILLEAGVRPTTKMLHQTMQKQNRHVCRLLLQHGADPFPPPRSGAVRQQEEAEEQDEQQQQPCPFLLAAREKKDTAFMKLFLEYWDEQQFLASNRDYLPIHFVCCDAQVSLPAIKLIVESKPDALRKPGSGGKKKERLLPLLLAASTPGASLDVIYYLFRQCPNALRPAPDIVARKDNQEP